MTNNKQRGLGRDLEALLKKGRLASTTSETIARSSFETAPAGDSALQKIALTTLIPGRYQPRRHFDEEALQELSESIKEQGIIQPLIVRPISADRYEIIAGERRFRAAQMAGLSEVPAVVQSINDQTASAFSLIENVQREDLSVMEIAYAYDRLTREFELTHDALSQLLGKPRVSISQYLRLLHLLPEVKAFLEHGDMDVGHAKALLALSGEDQVAAAKIVVDKSLSVRETEKLVKDWNKPKKSSVSAKKSDPDIHRLEEKLSEILGTKIEVKSLSPSKGQLTIHYSSLERLQDVLEKLGYPSEL
jgi:ParB family chromosome partitioning protein